MGDVPLRVRLQLLRGDLRPCRRPAQRRGRLDRDVASWWPRQHQRFGDASSQHSSPLHGTEPAAASSRVTEPPLDLEPRRLLRCRRGADSVRPSRAALDFLRIAMERCTTVGQPLGQ